MNLKKISGCDLIIGTNLDLQKIHRSMIADMFDSLNYKLLDQPVIQGKRRLLCRLKVSHFDGRQAANKFIEGYSKLIGVVGIIVQNRD